MDERIRSLERQGRLYEAERCRFKAQEIPIVWTSSVGRPLQGQPRPRLVGAHGVDHLDLAWRAFYLSRHPNEVLPHQERVPGRWDSSRVAISVESTLTVIVDHGKLSENTYASVNELSLIEVGAGLCDSRGRLLVVMSHLAGYAGLTMRRASSALFRESSLRTKYGDGRPCEIWDKRIKDKTRKTAAGEALIRRFEILWEHVQNHLADERVQRLARKSADILRNMADNR